MRRSPRFTGVLLFFCAFATLAGVQAQQTPPPVKLSLDGDPQPAHASGTQLGDAQCDGSGNVYLRYEHEGQNTSRVVRIQSDGSTEDFPLAPIPGHPDEAHVYTFSVADDGSLHESVQSWDNSGTDPDLRIYYVRYDQDGSVRSASAFEDDFTPFVLLPFSDGNFFAGGSVVKKSAQGEGVEESPRAGIFDSGANLVQELRKRATAQQRNPPEAVLPDDTALQPELVRMGGDGNIYVLVNSENVQLKVFRPTGVLAYQLKLRDPFEAGLPIRLLVSGDRALVVYEGEAEDPKDSFLYVLYDAHSGEIVRVYRPDFTGIPACMQDGQSITVLLPQKYSGGLSVGTASLQ